MLGFESRVLSAVSGQTRPLSGRRLQRAVAASAATLLAVSMVAAIAAAPALAQSPAVIYVSVSAGSGGNGTQQQPYTIPAAQAAAHSLSSGSDVIVYLEGGTYRLTQPLSFTSADSGQSGNTITYASAPGQQAIISGAEQVSGWTLQNSSSNIWVASVATGTNARQLYVNGAEAPRAALAVPRSDFTFTQTGLTIDSSSLNYLAGLSDQSQIEIESLNSFTDRYATVQSISGNTITMQEPGWANNEFGYDTIQAPFEGGAMSLENNYSFLQPGQWYLDSPTGQLFYEASSGQNPNTLDVELPLAQSLVDISGASSYSSPVTGLQFSNLEFTGTTWLGPSGPNGYADQQNGGHLVGSYAMPANWLTTCSSGCTDFEATRNTWQQIPGAVQVSAASNITFTGNTFTDLGEVGLAVGEDGDATASGVGLGASNINIFGNTFTTDAANGIVVGGIEPNAHHPSNPAMTNQSIVISDNLVNGVGTDYKEVSAILSTYVSQAVISHNQTSNLPYDGIDIGWGWGINDPGGSQDYQNRGTYNFQPVYSTATTLKNNTVLGNLIFNTKNQMHDGGSIYNLSANPGTVISNNYMYNNNGTVALYLDEGSRFLTLSSNVVQDAGVWAFTNANSNNNTDSNTFQNNWFNGGATEVATGSPHNNVLSNDTQVSGTNWPFAAQQVISNAGIRQFASLAASFNNVGITNDSNTAPGNYDGGGATFSEQALTAVGASPGATVASQGLSYTFPNVSGGTNDNTVADGQWINLSGSASTLGFLVSASFGPATGTGTIVYADGTTQSYTITGSDWWSTTAPSGGAVAVNSAYQDRQGNTTDMHTADIFSVTVPVNAAKTLAAVILPTVSTLQSGTAALHVFAVAQGGGSSSFPSGYHRLVIGNNSLCLDVFGNTGTAGAVVDQWTCNGQTNQQFQFVPVSGGYGELQAENSSDDVTIANNSTAQGTPDVVQEPVNGSASSLWLPVVQTDGSYEFQNQNSGLCLDVFGGNSTLGQQLDQWPCKNASASNQDFKPT